MADVLLIVQFVLVAIITVAVLLQKSSSIGLGAYSGSNESLFGAKGPGGFLAKFTFFIGLVFVVNTVALGYLYNQQKNSSIIESLPVVPNSGDAPLAPTAPVVPANSDDK